MPAAGVDVENRSRTRRRSVGFVRRDVSVGASR